MIRLLVILLGALIGCVAVLATVLMYCCLTIARHADDIENRILLDRQTRRLAAQIYTVRWRRFGTVECSYRGVIIPLDDDHMVIEGDDGPVVVCLDDLIEVDVL